MNEYLYNKKLYIEQSLIWKNIHINSLTKSKSTLGYQRAGQHKKPRNINIVLVLIILILNMFIILFIINKYI